MSQLDDMNHLRVEAEQKVEELRDLLREICFERDTAIDVDLLERAKELLQ